MRQVRLSGTDLTCSKFIFGTASLFNVGSQKERIRLLESAVDHGFTHFDTAPYYGFGIAEKDLSIILKRHPNITITTKVGIYSPGGENQSSLSVFMRKAVGRFVKNISKPTLSFELDKAKLSLDASLKRLGRDHVELYMLHEPTIDLILNTEEWVYWLENCVKSGKIRHFGLALTAEKLTPFLERQSELAYVIQMLDSLELKEADLLLKYKKPLQITYGYISAAQKSGSTRSVPEILQDALKRNANGAIIVSTTKTNRLSQYSDLADKL